MQGETWVTSDQNSMLPPRYLKDESRGTELATKFLGQLTGLKRVRIDVAGISSVKC